MDYRISRAGNNEIVRYSDGDRFYRQKLTGIWDETFYGSDGYIFHRVLTDDRYPIFSEDNVSGLLSPEAEFRFLHR